MDDKFSEGEKVRCKKPGHGMDSWQQSELEKGEVYTVSDAGYVSIEVEAVDNVRFCNYRFEKVESGFEVGDRVRKVSNSTTDYHSVNIGDEGEVISIEGGGVNVDWDIDYKHSVFYAHENELEPTSKGEGTMDKPVDTIAVEIDDTDMLEAIISKAKHKYGYVQDADIKHNYLLFGIDASVKGLFWSGKYPNDVGVKNLGKLTENWNEIVDFLEQANKQEPPSLNGHEAEVDGAIVKVGCWKGRYDKLFKFKELANDYIKMEKGSVTISDESVDVEELFEFIEDLQEYIDKQ